MQIYCTKNINVQKIRYKCSQQATKRRKISKKEKIILTGKANRQFSAGAKKMESPAAGDPSNKCTEM